MPLCVRKGKPVDVLRAGRCCKASSTRTNNKRVGVSLRSTLGGKVPLRADANTREGINDEVVLAEDCRRFSEMKELDHFGSG